MNKEKILFVDDDVNILDGFRRSLQRQFQVETAVGPIQGLKMFNDFGPFAVVVADLKMPKMDGIEFLTRIKEFYPETVRIMLTGHGDMEVAIDAINSGQVFRFLIKPCSKTNLIKALEAAIKQYRLVRAEKEIMEKTLTGTINVLTEILSITNEEALGRTSRIKRYVRDVAIHLGETDVWLYETGAILSQIGCIILPPGVLDKVRTGERLEGEELQLYMQHPFIASDLLRNIPRMEKVADMIAYQEKHYDGKGVPFDHVRGDDIPLGARILKVVLDFDLLETRGYSKRDSIYKMAKRKGRYDPKVFKAFLEVLQLEQHYKIRKVHIDDLFPFVVLLEDIVALNGVVLLKKGHEVTETIIEKLRLMDKAYGIKQPIEALIPPSKIIEEKRNLLEK
ncbi:response regulator [Desulfohalobiaceae bacterium Ax17]|uniref:HD domain-containing phosphohydrolase n=1 Tax=Desulfovulcanus ferrireducens TaxID=2831190 RepID=UPI00207BBF14|nr:response regulator [Desulfovulcanus ferrireducens]